MHPSRVAQPTRACPDGEAGLSLQTHLSVGFPGPPQEAAPFSFYYFLFFSPSRHGYKSPLL